MVKDFKIVSKGRQYQLFMWIFIFSLSACRGNKRRDEITKVTLEWIGKEIRFPENVPCYVSGRDSFPELCDEIFLKEYKILLYVDSAGCSDCRLKLFEWKQLMEEADTLFQENVGFLLYFQPKNVHDMANLFLRNMFDHPVFMDTEGSINRLNRFPQAMQYQCYLLDGDNKVISLGNPALNPQIWELYKSLISNEKKDEPKIFTSVEVDKMFHDYGSIRKGSTNSADFTISNTGSNPLVILRISTSCGCTDVTWDRQPIAPGQTTTVRVEMKPDETGPFVKTVVVYTNTNESPTKLTIAGETKD